MRHVFFWMVLGFPLVAGCGPKAYGPVPPTMDAGKYAFMQQRASWALTCPQEQLAYETFNNGRHLFKGCGSQVEMAVIDNLFSVPSAADRFAKELKCDLRSTSEQKVANMTYVVEGCGERITYLLVCRYDCNWVANVSSGKTQ